MSDSSFKNTRIIFGPRGLGRWLTLVTFATVMSLGGVCDANPWKDLVKSLPAEANAVALLDLEQIRKAGEGKSAEMQPIVERVDSAIPRGIRRLVMAASIDLDSLEPDWEVAVGDMGESRSIEQIAKSADGYVDQIGDKSVAWSRRGYFWKMNPATIALLRPADRQMMAKWMRTDDLTVTPALAEAIARPHDRDALFLALDLTDAVSRKSVRERLETSEIPNIKPNDFDRVAETVSNVRLISLSASVDRGLHGRCRIEFAKAPTLPADLMKGLFLEVLDRRGASLPDLSDWKARVEENALIMMGPMSARSWDDLVSFLSGPEMLSRQEQSLSMSDSSGSQSAGRQALLATKTYFNSVKGIVERVREHSAKSQGDRAVWNDRSAKKIDELPLLHVDAAMIDYGTDVAALLRGSGVTIRQANLDVGASKTRTSRGYDNAYAVNDNAAYNAQLKSQARAKGMGVYVKNLEQIDQKTAAIRRAMTEKFQEEF